MSISPNLSQPDHGLGSEAGEGGGAHESNEDGTEIEATTEPILDLGEIALGILGELERMIARNTFLASRSPVGTSMPR